MGLVSRFIAVMGRDKLREFANAEAGPILDETLDRIAKKRPLNKAAIYFLRDNAHEFLETAIDVTLDQHAQANGPEPRQPTMSQQSLAAIGAIALPLVWLLSRVNWSALWKRLPDVTPDPEPERPITEADYLPGDFAALVRLQERALRFGNPAMDDALTVVSEQFMVAGEGWEVAE